MAPSIEFPFPSHLSSKPAAVNIVNQAATPTTRALSTDTTSVVTTPSPPDSPSEAAIPTPPQSTLSKLSALYSALPRAEQTYLLQLTHFIHLHASSLQLTPYDLLTPVEESILRRSGKTYDALLKALSPHRGFPSAPTLEQLVALTHDHPSALRENYHKPHPAGSAKTGANAHELHACARPTRVHDSRNEGYMWIRGCANVSPRIARNDTLLVEPLLHAERLRMRGGRKDVFVSGWIASRVETAERVARGVRVEGERMAREMMERERKREMVESERRERSRRKCEERERWMREREERERCGVGVMTRRRREVCYVESEDEGEEEREEGEFVCEELIDGSDHDESASEEEEEEEETEEDSERENARVVGRVRVCVSERSRRAERRARLTEKYASEEEEDEDEGGRGVRRSKRLRMSK